MQMAIVYSNGHRLLYLNAKLFTSHRSIGLSEHEIYPLDFLSYISEKKDINFYFKKLN